MLRLGLLLLPAVLCSVLIMQGSVRTARGAQPYTVRMAQPSAFAPSTPRPAAKFPLNVASNGRYLEDSLGNPFLVKGDTAWSLIAELKLEDVDFYLRDRRARGFNTILVNLIEHYYATNAPANAYGDAPFLIPGRFDTPNDAYFIHADRVIQRAHEEGFLVLLAPCYTGGGGDYEGWYQEMLANGVKTLRDYGRYVGRRYRHFPNIIWVENGDWNPPRKELVRAIAEGIRQTNPHALQTVHNGAGRAGADYWSGESWLQLNNVYTYDPIFPAARAQYLRLPRLPFILVESGYENEYGHSTLRLRAQAYQALLTGAAGEMFGNAPIWYFDGTSDFPQRPRGWQRALGSAGSQSMAHLHELFTRLPWHTLEPDIDNSFLVRGQGHGHMRAVAAMTPDRSTAVVYIPDNRTVTLDLSKLRGRTLRARWYDPTNGKVFEMPEPLSRPKELERFRPAAKNAARVDDWVLLLQAEKDDTVRP